MKLTTGRIAALAATLLTLPAFAAEQIKVVERPVGETTVDLGPKGDSVGDMLVFANGVFDAANKTQVGSDQGYCVRTIVGKSWECSWTLTLNDGRLRGRCRLAMHFVRSEHDPAEFRLERRDRTHLAAGR